MLFTVATLFGCGSDDESVELGNAAEGVRSLVDSTAAEVLPGAVPERYEENESPNGRQSCSSKGDEVREDYGLTFKVRSDEAEGVIEDVRAYWRSLGLMLDEADVAPGENAVATRQENFGVRATEIGPPDDPAISIAGSTECFSIR